MAVSSVEREAKMDNGSPTVLAVRALSKDFAGHQALIDIDLELYRGDVLAIVGDNGAGKSTLVKILSGVHHPTSGQIFIDGEKIDMGTPRQARELGVETVYQDLALVDDIDVTRNFFLGQEVMHKNPVLRWIGYLDLREMRRRAREAIARVHIKIPKFDSMKIRNMSGGQRQAVAIARGVLFSRKLLLLDEPTSALGVEETREVKKMIVQLSASSKIPMIVISHNLQDVFDIANRIVVLRLGKKVADLRVDDTNPQEVISYITGLTTQELH